MTANDVDETDLPAGDFSSWLIEIAGAIRGERGSDVPCDGCTACCSSSQFVHIGPEEIDTLAHIPDALLFPAPRLPRGHVLMGYDENGKCPMLIDERCSIYEHRPLTCRTYDCRIFPATGLDVDDDDKELIAQRARRWRFAVADQDGRDQFEAVQAAARYLSSRPEVLPNASLSSATQLAVQAIGIHDVFLRRHDPPADDEVRVALRRRPG